MAWSAAYRSCCGPARSRSPVSPWSPWPGSRGASGSSTPRRRAAPLYAAGRAIPVAERDSMLINFLGPPSDPGGGGPFRIIPLADVLDGAFDPEWVQDKIVLVGFTTPGIDEHPTPDDGRSPDVGCRDPRQRDRDDPAPALPACPRRAPIVVALIVAPRAPRRAPRGRSAAARHGAARPVVLGLYLIAASIAARSRHHPGPGAPAGRAPPDLRHGTGGPRRVRAGRAAPDPRGDGAATSRPPSAAGCWPIPAGCAWGASCAS